MLAADAAFARRAALVCGALALAKVLLHEPWRDELNLWQIAEARPRLCDFYAILDYGGHPRLWHTAVWVLARLGDDYRAVQILQAGLATASAWLALRFAPFPRPLRLVLVFGYFPFFEYGTIARPYGLGMLLAFAACAVGVRRPRAPLAFACLLALLAQTTVFGALAALALAAGFACERVLETRARPRAPETAALALFAAALALAVIQMIPAPDATYAQGWRTGWDAERAAGLLRRVVEAWAPLPPWRIDFWNRHLLDGAPGLAAALGATLFGVSMWTLRKQPPALALFAVGTAGCLAFAYAKGPGGLRHVGVLWLVLLAACWWADARPGGEPAATRRLRRGLLAGVLAVQLVAGVHASALDLWLPFSASGEAARFLRERGLANAALVGDPHGRASPLAHYLARPIFFPDWGEAATFHYHRRGVRATGPAVALDAARALAAQGEWPVVLVLGYPLEPPPADVEELARFARSLARERYYLYALRWAP